MMDRSHILSAVRQAKLLGFSRGSVCYLSRQVSDAEPAFMRRVDEMTLDYPVAGIVRHALHMPVLIKAGKPPKVAISEIMPKLIVLANALLPKKRKWIPNTA